MFNSTAYGTELLQLEQKWNQENTTYPTTPTGDTLQVALRISQKYATTHTHTHAHTTHAHTARA
jgi:hypothetical protein